MTIPPLPPADERLPVAPESPWRAHRGVVATLVVLMVSFLVADTLLFWRWRAIRIETDQLTHDAGSAGGATASAELAAQQARFQLTMDRIRADARADKGLHLSVDVDSGVLSLERDGIALRTMSVVIGPESLVGTLPDTQRLAVPRGVRQVERVIPKGATWEVPAWVFPDRGLPEPDQRKIKDALGAGAAVLDGGTLLYAIPPDGPLADSMYVLPGAIRLDGVDLKAVLPNLKPGLKVYLY